MKYVMLAAALALFIAGLGTMIYRDWGTATGKWKIAGKYAFWTIPVLLALSLMGLKAGIIVAGIVGAIMLTKVPGVQGWLRGVIKWDKTILTQPLTRKPDLLKILSLLIVLIPAFCLFYFFFIHPDGVESVVETTEIADESSVDIKWGVGTIVIGVILAIGLFWMMRILFSVIAHLTGSFGTPVLRFGAILFAVLTIAIVNAIFFWYAPDFWQDAWKVWKTTETDEGKTVEVLVLGWSFWAFWSIQVLGVAAIYFFITGTRKEKGGNLIPAVIIGTLVVLAAVFFASYAPGEFKEERELKKAVAEAEIVHVTPASLPTTVEPKVRTGTLSWTKPKGVAGRYPDHRSSRNRVEVRSRDDSERISEITVFSNSGGILTRMIWNLKTETGSFSNDEGSWFLKQISPSFYEGWWEGPGSDWQEVTFRLILDH